MDFIDDILDIINDWFDKLFIKINKKEEVVKEEKVKEQKSVEQIELEFAQQQYRINKRIENLKQYKKQLEDADFENQHSCKFCKFCKSKEDRYTVGKEYHCLVKEECIAIYDIYALQRSRESMDKYKQNNDCIYFKKIENYFGYSIKEIMEVTNE